MSSHFGWTLPRSRRCSLWSFQLRNPLSWPTTIAALEPLCSSLATDSEDMGDLYPGPSLISGGGHLPALLNVGKLAQSDDGVESRLAIITTRNLDKTGRSRLHPSSRYLSARVRNPCCPPAERVLSDAYPLTRTNSQLPRSPFHFAKGVTGSP